MNSPSLSLLLLTVFFVFTYWKLRHVDQVLALVVAGAGWSAAFLGYLEASFHILT